MFYSDFVFFIHLSVFILFYFSFYTEKILVDDRRDEEIVEYSLTS